MGMTNGLNHLGLSVLNLDDTTDFFTNVLEWEELARDESYPRTTVSDGNVRLTLWQVDHANSVISFDRRSNVGLHHVAFEVQTEQELSLLSEKIKAWPGVTIEFMPEPLGDGPRKHMMFSEPGGIRLEIIWPGS